MQLLKKFKPTPALFAVVAVAVLVGGGSATAGSLITSKQIKNGTIKKADLSKSAIKSLSGKSGPAGAAGPAGPAGAAATNLWAVVEADASPQIIRAKGAVSVADINVGIFDVKFDRDISACAWQVTAGSTGGASSEIAFATAELKNVNSPDSLYIKVYDAAGAYLNSGTSKGFHVSVFC